MAHRSNGDVRQLFGLIAIAALCGILINSIRESPLPWIYQSASARVAHNSQRGPASQPTMVGSTPQKENVSARLISIAETKELLTRPDVIILDARPALFFKAGHLPGALSLPHELFLTEFRKLEPVLRRPGVRGFLIYCSGGECEDSAGLAEDLLRVGIGPLAIYEGGWEEWSATGERTIR